MSVDGTPALRSKTRKYKSLLAFLMASLMWLFQVRSQEIVRPKILTLSTTESSNPLISRASKACLFLLEIDQEFLAFIISALSCIGCFPDQSSTRLTTLWVLARGKTEVVVVSSVYI